jgi:apoptosis-inducing factor 2
MDPRTVVSESGLVSVLRTMQLYVPPTVSHDVEAGTNDVLLHWLQDMSLGIGEEGETESQVQPSPPRTAGAYFTSTPSSPRTLCSPYSLSSCSSTDTLVESESLHETLYPNIFVVGDAADAFDAIKAGHTAYYQAEVAARNILRLIHRGEKVGFVAEEEAEEDLDSELEEYAPGPPAIKVSLGLTKSAYEVNGVVGTKGDGVDDLNAAAMWAVHGMRDVSEDDMLA